MKKQKKVPQIVKWPLRTDCLLQEMSGISSITLNYLLSCSSDRPTCSLLVHPAVPPGTPHLQLCRDHIHAQTVVSPQCILSGDKYIKLNKALGQGKRTRMREERTDCETTPTGTRQGGFMLQVEMLSNTAQKLKKKC